MDKVFNNFLNVAIVVLIVLAFPMIISASYSIIFKDKPTKVEQYNDCMDELANVQICVGLIGDVTIVRR